MIPDQKTCQNCKTNFIIELDDFTFYEKIGVPPPTWCPECRLIRRLAWRNDLTFYNRSCDLCGKRMISLYHPEKKLTVYCSTCWWSDTWDPKSYGRDIDFSRPFFEQFRELQDVVPQWALFNDDGIGSVNCEYTQNVTFAKNNYMVSMSWKGENIMYSYHIDGPEAKDNIDDLDLFGHTQVVYDSVCADHMYNCRNCYYSSGLTDCSFCYDCKGCSDCFMSVNLRQKKYCILNKQYSKQEYEDILKSYRLDTYSGVERAKKEFEEFLLTQPRRFAYMRNNNNSTGNVLFNCKNVHDAAWAVGCEDTRFLWRGTTVKDSYDMTPSGENSTCYEGLTPDHDERVHFSIYSLKSHDLQYVENCQSSRDLFGCSAMRSAQYCILNKQYTKEAYLAMRDKLIAHMKRTGEYGEFFPARLSHFGYNETMASVYYPLSKEEAEAKGFTWWDNIQKTIGKETIQQAHIPDLIADVSDSILNEVLACDNCKRNYKIIKDEFTFYKKHSIPIPRTCFYCRHAARLKFESPFQLWHRKCAKCPNEFETSYSPERPEIIYCESCYKSEIM